MPHATETMTNGEKASSQFVSHITSYPVVSDSIETYKSNPYGKKSIEVADNVYSRFGKPVEPYLETPYSYAKPYLQKADQLADSGLATVESHFPIVKEDTNTIIDTTKSYVFWPYNYLSNTWSGKQIVYHIHRHGVLTCMKLQTSTTRLPSTTDVAQVLPLLLSPSSAPRYVRDTSQLHCSNAPCTSDWVDASAEAVGIHLSGLS